MTETNQENYYSVSQMADKLGMSQKGIRDLIHRHNLPASRIGKGFRIKESDFIRFFEENRISQ